MSGWQGLSERTAMRVGSPKITLKEVSTDDEKGIDARRLRGTLHPACKGGQRVR
jgi:hypothetical protein